MLLVSNKELKPVEESTGFFLFLELYFDYVEILSSVYFYLENAEYLFLYLFLKNFCVCGWAVASKSELVELRRFSGFGDDAGDFYLAFGLSGLF